MNKLKILIVDDSQTDAAILKHLFTSESDMQVVGHAINGLDALQKIDALKPDIVTMDLLMPVMDGFTAIEKIMTTKPIPIVVISSVLDDTSIDASFRAIEAGALYVLDKPRDITSNEFITTKQFFLDIIRTMSEVNVVKKRPYLLNTTKQIPPVIRPFKDFDLLAIGASAGGPQAITKILSAIDKNFPIPIVVTQHMSAGFIMGFANWLNNKTQLTVKVVENNELLLSGFVYIAPDNLHFKIVRTDNKYAALLDSSPLVSGFRPSINVMIESVANATNGCAIGLLLSGMGEDGAKGLLALHKLHGHTIIQDAASSVVFGIASVAQNINAVDIVLELDKIAPYLNQLKS